MKVMTRWMDFLRNYNKHLMSS